MYIFHKKKKSQFLLYYKSLFPLLFHNPEGTRVGRSVGHHNPVDTDRSLLDNGNHLDILGNLLLPHQSCSDTSAPKMKRWSLEVCLMRHWPQSRQRSHLIREDNMQFRFQQFTHNSYWRKRDMHSDKMATVTWLQDKCVKYYLMWPQQW